MRARHSLASLPASAQAPVARLAGIVIVNAIKRHATRIVMEREASDRAVVKYEIDGLQVEELRPPAKLYEMLLDEVIALGASSESRPGWPEPFDVVDEDGFVALSVEIRRGENEWGATLTLELGRPARPAQ